jgi:hypothetical protein
MDSMCSHQEQVLPRLASRSIQRIAESMGFVIGYLPWVVRTTRHRFFGVATDSVKRPIFP